MRSAVASHLFHRGYLFILPELSWYGWYADLIAWGNRPGILEVEIKMSWNDYKADFLKSGVSSIGRKPRPYQCVDPFPPIKKYDYIFACLQRWSPTHFCYAAPEELAERIGADQERPKHFGVWAFKQYETGSHMKREWYFRRTVAPMKRIRKIQPQEMDQFHRAAGRKALYMVRDTIITPGRVPGEGEK